MSERWADNPYTKIYDALFDLVFDNSHGIGDLVRPTSRIRYDAISPDDPALRAMASADAPVVGISPDGIVVNHHAANTIVEAELLFSIDVLTQDMRISRVLFPIQWGLTVALSKSDSDLGLDYVRRVWLYERTSDTLDTDPKRTLGWATVATIGVLAHFDRDTIKLDGSFE